jgi:hypothetical protein
MNSLSDILSEKADALFPEEPPVMPDELPVPAAASTAPAPSPTAPLKQMIFAMKDQLDAMLRLLDGETVPAAPAAASAEPVLLPTGERVLEGVFTGEKMRGNDGKEYSVPPNYASKSKLVDGDRMKLTITKSGSFIYKQIGPADRMRAVGTLVHDDLLGQWSARTPEGELYKILTASVTFYKGKPGDEVILLLPRTGQTLWAAVDNIIEK